MTDRHDDAARVGCPKCHGSGFTSPRGYSTADPKPCPECKRVAALLRETERTAVRRCEEIEAIRCFGSNAPSAIRAEYPEHFGGDDDD